MRCKACRNNGDIADNSSSYVKESGCTNYTLKSVKGHTDSKQHRKVELLEDRIRNAISNCIFRRDCQQQARGCRTRALSMLTTSVAARVNLRMRNAHAVAKHGRPYTDFTWMATRFE